MIRQSGPLRGTELHAPPVIVARGVLSTKNHTEGFFVRGLGVSDMHLKFDSISSCVRRRIDKGMSLAKRAVMRLSHLRDDVGPRTDAQHRVSYGNRVKPDHDVRLK